MVPTYLFWGIFLPFIEGVFQIIYPVLLVFGPLLIIMIIFIFLILVGLWLSGIPLKEFIKPSRELYPRTLDQEWDD